MTVPVTETTAPVAPAKVAEATIRDINSTANLPETDAAPRISPEEYAQLVEAQKDAQKIIERAPTNEVPLSELQGIELSEQFYRVWGTPERGQALWESWQRTLGQAADTLLEQFATSTAEEMNITPEEARWRLAVDKVLHDCGPQFAVKFMQKYYTQALQKQRTLQPMAPRRRKK